MPFGKTDPFSSWYRKTIPGNWQTACRQLTCPITSLPIPNKKRSFSTTSKTESSPWKDRIENLKRATIPGEPIEEAQLISLSGDTVFVSELPDQPTLVYFYFSTCGHSASYFKNYLFPLYQELEAEGIKLIAISVDEDSDLWKERISKYSDPSIPNFNLRGISKERWKELYEITSFPRVMLLDRDSRILSFDIKPLGETKEELLQEFRKKFNDELSTNTNTSL